MNDRNVLRSRALAPRWTRGALAALALMILSGCGGDDPPATPPAATPAAPAAQAPAATTPAAPAPTVAPASVDDLLKSARKSLAEQRLVTPPADNAIEYYLAVLAQEPGNVQATQALVDIFPLVASIAEREIAQKNVAEGERIIALLDKASPNSYTVTTLRTKLDTLRQQVARDEQRLLAQQQAAQQAAQQPAATTPAPAAPATPEPTPAAPPARTVQQPAPEPAAPAATPAPAPATPPPAAVAESREARVVRQVQPTYPVDAARKRVEGWVELEFTIGTDGRVRDVSVLRAQPPRIFDREAMRALQQWTFEPAVANGTPTEQRSRRRMEFQL